MNTKFQTQSQSENLSWLNRFLLLMAGFYFVFTWAPQFLSTQFTPASIAVPMKTNGVDLLAVQVSADRLIQGKSARFLDPSDGPEVFPYPIGNTIHAYGGLSIVAFLPFHSIKFERLRKVWFICELGALFLLSFLVLRNQLNLNELSHKIGLLLFFALTLIFSGPLNLGLERGNIELLLPLGLYLVCIQLRTLRPNFITSTLLGVLVHIKVWPIFLLSLLSNLKQWKYLLISVLVIALLPLALNPWLPIGESLQAMASQGSATAQMLGGVNISLYSLLKTLHLNFDWHWVSVLWLALNGLIFLSILNSEKLKPSLPSDFDLLFGAAICVALLSPACLFEYCLGAVFLIIPAAMSFKRKWLGEALLAGILSSAVFLHYYNGLFKSLLILALLGVLLWEYFESRFSRPIPLS